MSRAYNEYIDDYEDSYDFDMQEADAIAFEMLARMDAEEQDSQMQQAQAADERAEEGNAPSVNEISAVKKESPQPSDSAEKDSVRKPVNAEAEKGKAAPPKKLSFKQQQEAEAKAENAARIKSIMETRVTPMGGYKDTFIAHQKEHTKRFSTGFLSLDIALSGGLSNELYIMAAETSTGKSAFMMAIAQNIAAAGTDVLYFALEMGRDEFVARGISTISFETSLQNEQARKVTAANVLYWTYDSSIPVSDEEDKFVRMSYQTYEQYADEYFRRYGEHLYIVESGIGGLSSNDLANIATLHRRRTKKPVVVFVDYLQLLSANDDIVGKDRKSKIDASVATLKRLASQIGMPVFTVSSVQRAGYNGRVGTASYKESGDTEYTGGILIGWNWHGVTDTDDADKKEQAISSSKETGIRHMILDVLKARNDARNSEIKFDYYPAYNYFSATDGGSWEAAKDVPEKFLTNSQEKEKKIIRR